MSTGIIRKLFQEVEQNMYEAIEFHLKGMQEDKQPIPQPTSTAEYIVVK